MEARKLALQVMAVSPFVVVLGVGFNGRHAPAAHQFLSYSTSQEQTVERYHDVARISDAILSPNDDRNDTDTRRVADLWITSAASGKLAPLPPAFYDEIGEDGPRSEILTIWSRVIGALEGNIADDNEAGRYDDAAADLSRLIRVAMVCKYSDLSTINTADAAIKHGLANAAWLGKSSPKAAQDVTDAVKFANYDGGRLHRLMRGLSESFTQFQGRESEIEEGTDPAASGPSSLTIDSVDMQVQVTYSTKRDVALRKMLDEYLSGHK